MNAEKRIHSTDFLVIGSGIAGLTFALKIANQFSDCSVTIVTKNEKKNAIRNMRKEELQQFGIKQLIRLNNILKTL